MPMMRPNKVAAVMAWLGDLATEEDATKVLEALEADGREVVYDPEKQMTILRPDFESEDAWWQFVEDVLGEGGRVFK